MSDYRAHASAYRTPAFDRKTVTQELAWLESLRDMERKSVERAEAAGIIRNVGREDVRRGAEPAVSEGKVRLRKGWKSLIMEVLRRGGRVDVVSVTWSGTFVTTCLRSVAEGIEEPIEITNQGAGVWANEIRGGNEGRMDRYFENDGKEGKGGIWTAGDKMRVMNELTALEIEGEITVYVGDSTTDLQCLLSADVGVCIRNAGETSGEQRELEQTLRTLGVGCQWIGRMNPDDLNPKPRQDASEIGNRLWWATNFDEICQSPLVQTDASAEKNNASILVYNMPPCYQSSEPMILQSLQGLPVGRC